MLNQLLLRVIGNVLPESDEITRAEETTEREDHWPLRNEELVLQHLSDHEGTTWQTHVMAELGWSSSKTSRVLAEMEDAGAIRRYRIGRQNAVFLPGHEPDCLKSTLNDGTASPKVSQAHP